MAGTVSLLPPATAHADGSAPVAPDPETAASAQAQATGAPVTVDADTTAYTQTVANPDGSFTLTDQAVPVRVAQASDWVPVDPTLRVQPDGTVAPGAVESSVTFSDGGTGALATVTDPAGHSVSISSRKRCPHPPSPVPRPPTTRCCRGWT